MIHCVWFIDDNGLRLTGGDILVNMKDWAENRKVLSSPPQHQQSLRPNFDYHRKYWKRKIPYLIKSSLNEGKLILLFKYSSSTHMLS